MKLPTRKCKNCGATFQKLTPLHFVCSPKCAIAYAKEIQVKRERQEAKQAKAETRERLEKFKSRSKLLKETQREFNLFIRERDRGLPCISCGSPLNFDGIGGGYDCGHYRSVGSAPHLRFNENNAHAQCKHCNRWLSGNAVNYRKNLINKIGLDEVEKIESDNQAKKYTTQDLVELKAFYRKKTKELKINKNIKCSIDGCDRPMHYQKNKICQMHYFRFMRNKTFDTVKEPRKERIENPAGYQKLYKPEHKLSNSDGYVYEHRYLVYEKYGEFLPSCEACGKNTSWDTCHIDHVDKNVKNNDINNLRPLCRGCNTKRTKRSTAIKLEVNGVEMSIIEWSRQPDVKVSYSTIKKRLEAGYSPYEAVYGEKVTHKLKQLKQQQEVESK